MKNDGGVPGRMWAFVTYADTTQAAVAVAATHEKLVFPGATRPCDVNIARASGQPGTLGPGGDSLALSQLKLPDVMPTTCGFEAGPVKLFVECIPCGTTEQVLREEFQRYGPVTDVFLRNDATEVGRMWAFITYVDQASAAIAVAALHDKFVLPGGTKPISVSNARSPSPPVTTSTSTSYATLDATAWSLSGSADVATAAGLGSSHWAFRGSSDVTSTAIVPMGQSLPSVAPPLAETPKAIVTMPSAFTTPAIQSGPTKLFVGSIPAGTTQQMLHEEFSKFGPVAEVFLKNDATEPGRMWGFVTYVNPDGAAAAAATLNEKFVFPGGTRPLAVSFARSSSSSMGLSDNTSALSSLAVAAASNPNIAPAASVMAGPTKLFIGSIPAGTTKEALREEFERFGLVMDVFLKNDISEPHRMWGFVTYRDAGSAAAAVTALHERLVLPGGSRPCAVSFARNSQAQHSMAAANLAQAMSPSSGTTKLFIGTIPVGTTEAMLRTEFEKYGQVVEIFLKYDGTDSGRMWGFLTYADAQSAAVAVSALHEKLMLPGSVRPCAVSFARSSSSSKPGDQANCDSVSAALPSSLGVPPPDCDWKVYYTVQGLPYYHNSKTGVTQWECPSELCEPPAGSTSLAVQGAASALSLLASNAAAVDQKNAVTAKTADGAQQRYSPY